MAKWFDKNMLRVSVYAAASLMSGVLLAVWLRVLDAVAGRTVYSLAACVVTVAVGLAAGFAGGGWLFRKSLQPAVVLCAVLLFMAGCLALQLMAVSGIVAGWQRILNDLSRSVWQYGMTLGKTVAFLVLVPSALAGVAARLSLLAYACSPSRQRGQAVTLLVLLGAVPAALGYGAAAGVLVPLAGTESVLRLATLWFGALASLALARGLWSALPFVAVAGALALTHPNDRAPVLADGVFSRLIHRDSGFASGTPIFFHHSRHHTVTVYDDPDYRFVFALDGRPLLFGNRFHTSRTLSGYIPLLLNPGCKKAAVFGPEAGFYLPFFVRAGVGDVAYAGADPDVVKLALAADGDVAGDDMATKPGAVRRGATLSPNEAYDLVFLASEPVWMRGTGKAYSRGLFRRCRDALSADGRVALHLDARALSPKRFASIAQTFSREFPDTQVWCTGAYDWLLVGGTKAQPVPADKMLALFEKDAVVRDFARAGVLSVPEVLSCLLCDGTGLAAWLERAGREAACAAAWRAPLTAFRPSDPVLTPSLLEPCRQRKAEWLQPGTLDEGVVLAIRAKTEQCVGARASAVIALAETSKGLGDAGLSAARAAARLNPRDALLLHFSETLELEARRRIAIGEFKGALRCYENLLSFSPGSARSHYGMGYCLRAGGENEDAYLHFARAVAAAPEQTGYRMEMAQVALTVGEFREADRQFQEVLKREPNNAEALFRYAKGLVVKERPDKDMAKALKLAERACVLTHWDNKEYAFGLGDLYMDAGRVMEGMGLKRCLKAGVKPGSGRGDK